MRILGILVVLGLIVGAGVFAFTKIKENGLRGEGQKEFQAQVTEKQECEKRLALFYKAVTDYQKDHKGAMPPSFVSLLPKYIRSGDLLVCPTAQRWTKKGAAMAQGQIEFNRRNFPVTYMFRWLTPTYTHGVKKYGDEVPLIVCDAHKEGIYRSVYHKRPPADAFDNDNRGSLVSEVRDAKMLAVRKNGKVGELASDQEF
jgi:hypothetical protein